MAASCKTCKKSGAFVREDKSIAMVCRARPAVPFASAVNTPTGPGWMTTTVWPPVTENDWCAEHVPNLSLAN